MIYVHDNGEDYSDHELTFIEVPDGVDEKHRDLFLRALKATPLHATACVVGVFREIAWYRGGSMPVKEWLTDTQHSIADWLDWCDTEEEEELTARLKLVEDALAVLP